MGWERWVPRWQTALSACERLGGSTLPLRIGSPATMRAVEEAEREIGRSVPQSLRAVLLGFSGDVEFYWSLPDTTRPPAPFAGIFYGECRWRVADLVWINQDATWLAENCFTEDDPDHRLWSNKFVFQSIASGDFLAIDTTEADSQPVVYLSHELDWGHGYRLGPSFGEFVDRWTRLGCPSDDIFPLFVPDRTGDLDVQAESVKQWCEWFGLPDPTVS